MKALKAYITSCSRHKLLFTSTEIENVQFVDIGAELSALIEPYLQKKRLPMIADDSLESIIHKNTNHHAEIGEYIAIKNYGILFESDLHFNLHAKFDSWSKTKILIVFLEGTIKNKIFRLSKSENDKYSINLNDITCNILYNEI